MAFLPDLENAFIKLSFHLSRLHQSTCNLSFSVLLIRSKPCRSPFLSIDESKVDLTHWVFFAVFIQKASNVPTLLMVDVMLNGSSSIVGSN